MYWREHGPTLAQNADDMSDDNNTVVLNSTGVTIQGGISTIKKRRLSLSCRFVKDAVFKLVDNWYGHRLSRKSGLNTFRLH